MALHAILKNTVGGLWWLEEATDSEIKEYEDYLLYIVDDAHSSGFHVCDKSALYDDMTGYEDLIQREDELKDDEFYVVLYDECYENDKSCGLLSSVDFGVTKQDIIQNVLNNKYVESALYFTVGQMMKTTLDYQNGVYNG